MMWISQATGYNIPPPPNILFVETSEEMFNIAHECHNKENALWCKEYKETQDTGDFEAGSNILGLYDRKTKTILLKKSWNAESIVDRSILLHELVHHLQYENESVDRCKGEIEQEAYEVQDEWLNQYGTNIFDALNLGYLYYLTIITCQLL